MCVLCSLSFGFDYEYDAVIADKGDGMRMVVLARTDQWLECIDCGR